MICPVAKRSHNPDEIQFLRTCDVSRRPPLVKSAESVRQNTTLNKFKNSKLRIKNIKVLLLSFYLLFPPLRLEAFKLKVIKNGDDYKHNDASINIKDDNNIFSIQMLKRKSINQ